MSSRDNLFKDFKEWLSNLESKEALTILERFDEVEDSLDYKNLAEDIFDLKESKSKEYAKILTQKAIDEAKDSFDYSAISNSIADEDYLNDKFWAKELYKKAINVAKEFIEYVDVAKAVIDNLSDREWARELFKKSIETLRDSEDGFNNFDLINIAETISMQRYLNDKSWAREVYKEAYSLERDFDETIALANSIADEDYLSDKVWAKELYQEAYSLEESFENYLEVAESVMSESYLNDKEWARDILIECEELAKSVREYSQLIDAVYLEDNLNDREWADRLLNETLEKCEEIEDYSLLFGTIDYRNLEFGEKIVKLALPLIDDEDEIEEWADNIEFTLENDEWAQRVRNFEIDELSENSEFSSNSQKDSNSTEIQKSAIYFTLAVMKWLRVEKELEDITNYRVPRDFISDRSDLDFYFEFSLTNNEAITYASEAKEGNIEFENFLETLLKGESSSELFQEIAIYLNLFKFTIKEYESEEISNFYSEKINYIIDDFLEGEREEKLDSDLVEIKAESIYNSKLKESESYRNWKLEEDESSENEEDSEDELKELMDIFDSLYLMEKNGTIHEDMVNDIYSHSFKYIYKELNGKEACESYCDGYPIEDFGDAELIEEMYRASDRRDEIIDAMKTIMNCSIHSSKYMDYYEAIEKSRLPTKSVDSIEDVLDVVREDGSQLEKFEEYQGDREVVLEAVKNYSGWATPFEYATDELKSDRDFVLEVVEVAGQALEYASEELQDDKEIALKAIKNSASAYEFISDRLKLDREVVLEAVKSNGNMIRELDEKFQNDREIALQAVVSDPDSIESISEEFQNDKTIALVQPQISIKL